MIIKKKMKKKKTGVEIRSSALSFLSREDNKLKEWPKSHSSFPSRPAPDAFIFDQICILGAAI